MKTYIEEFLMTFSGFHQTVFSFLTAYSLQQLFPQLTAHSNFFHSHSPTKQTLGRGYGCATRDLGMPSNRWIPSPMALPFTRHSTSPASFQFTSHLALHVVVLLRETMLFE
jgi:hypothetical protein